MNINKLYGFDIGSYVYFDKGAEVIKNISIGSLSTALSSGDKYDIIVNLSGYNYNSIPHQIQINIDDKPLSPQEMKEYDFLFNHFSREISKYRNKKILIHCAAGINRSATLIGYYLLSLGYDLDTVYKLLKDANNKRNVHVLTNSSFRELLRKKFYS